MDINTGPCFRLGQPEGGCLVPPIVVCIVYTSSSPNMRYVPRVSCVRVYICAWKFGAKKYKKWAPRVRHTWDVSLDFIELKSLKGVVVFKIRVAWGQGGDVLRIAWEGGGGGIRNSCAHSRALLVHRVVCSVYIMLSGSDSQRLVVSVSRVSLHTENKSNQELS